MLLIIRIFFIAIPTFANAELWNSPKILEETLFYSTNLLTHEDIYLDMMQLIEKYDYPGEQGAKLHKGIVLLEHCLLGDSSEWLLAGPNRSLGFILADMGFDVWLGNARGNPYPIISPNISEKDYWNFSNDRLYILNKTGSKKMFYIGHSQGTLAFFVMGSKRPEYMDKIEVMFAMAPIAYIGNTKGLVKLLSKFFGWGTSIIPPKNVNPNRNFTRIFLPNLCSLTLIQSLCLTAIYWVIGPSSKQFDTTLLPQLLGHLPTNAAVKQFIHSAQIIKTGKFRQFDYGKCRDKKVYGSREFRQFNYGKCNEEVYNGSPIPPNYNLSKVTASVHLVYSDGDWLSSVTDVAKVYSELGNPRQNISILDKDFNHLDYMMAKNVRKLVYNKIINLMKNYL